MNRMRCSLVIFAMLLFLSNGIGQQMMITVPPISGTLVRSDNLWNITVVSTAQTPVHGRVQITLVDRSNITVLSAVSSPVLFSKGTKVLNYGNVSPVSFNYNAIGNRGDYLKAGNYTVCYLIIPEQSKENFPLAEECVDVNIEAMTPPLLVFPAENSIIYENHPAFSWIPPSPLQLFNSLMYQLKVVEMLEWQTPLDALETNSPVYIETNIIPSFKNLPNSNVGLKEDKNYAWQVFAIDGKTIIKSEPWKFRVVKDSIMQIIESSPYISMRLNKPEFGVMHQGYVKVVLNNYSTDTIAVMEIIEEGGADQVPIASVIVPVKAGENYVLKALDKKIRLSETKFYQLVWMNSRGERWVVRYKPKYYNNN